MTFMRAAIAGKPDEQFAGDDQNGQSLDQAKAQPLNSGSRRRSRNGSATTDHCRHSGRASSAGNRARRPVDARDSAKNTAETAHNCSASTPQVRPALQLQNTSGRAPTTVKPALAFPQR